jgi:hypothetical protein
MAKKKKTCSQCYFYESLGNCGECYCHPPVNDGNAETTVDYGAIVKEDRRACGEFK